MDQEVLRWLTQFVVGLLGSGGVAYMLFGHYGKGWLDKKFAQSLENHRHQQSLEIQRLRVEIDSLLNGTIRLQEYEFKVLPEVWEKLYSAYSYAINLLSPFQEYNDLSQMDALRLEEFLDSSPLLGSDKKKIISADAGARNNLYQEAFIWHRMSIAHKNSVELGAYISRYAIFFPGQLKEKLDSVSKAIHSALSSKRFSLEDPSDPRRLDGWRHINDAAAPLYAEIQQLIQERLRSHGQVKNAD
ncbi:hypothetical protein VUJ49_22760 [Pseudomonas berkeleyensis]|uniref:Uncharacterized protein n=1 Tax=Pseudomonas berkeleyensis TaxID=2726956 RepID=A0A7G5DM19_9PSED|nr:hypothetical protein [Pseudomonas berkeleyensis]QMV62794.1 hypothetical protein HS968_22665 [Pseudomonas berkeleyensis]WSO38244.1 hypothetical protein VUJ49_22760 [Pseudomonas berkeleyensis]